MAKILTVSMNEETESLWKRVKDRGIGQAEFMREALNFYIENGYKFKDPPVVGEVSEENRAL
jgi:hypothetical protein